MEHDDHEHDAAPDDAQHAGDTALTATAISAAMLRLRVREPFFATLCLFARFIPNRGIPTACTDGRDVYYHPDFFAALRPAQLEGAILHEILHAALLHVTRRGSRDAARWNIAADIVVNGVLAALPSHDPIPGEIREPRLEHLPVEEIYSLLEETPTTLCLGCLLPDDGVPNWRGRLHDTEAYWRDALHKARTLAESQRQGQLPAGLLRHIDSVTAPQIDWRAALWRFLVRTPVDFTGYDRRFLHTGLYLDALDGERVRVFVAVDTSGSISEALLAMLLGEVKGILGTYPHIEVTLYYCDADLDGPYSLRAGDPPPAPVGGGGTSFVPFFAAVAAQRVALEETLCVYLTDGYGTFPDAPSGPVLWVVTPGGLANDDFPFGQVIRLLLR